MTNAPDPRVAFGMWANLCALKAKIGTITLRDRLALSSAVLRLAPEDVQQRVMVADFLDNIDVSPLKSGEALQNQVLNWVAGISPSATADALNGISSIDLQDWQNQTGAGFD